MSVDSAVGSVGVVVELLSLYVMVENTALLDDFDPITLFSAVGVAEPVLPTLQLAVCGDVDVLVERLSSNVTVEATALSDDFDPIAWLGAVGFTDVFLPAASLYNLLFWVSSLCVIVLPPSCSTWVLAFLIIPGSGTECTIGSLVIVVVSVLEACFCTGDGLRDAIIVVCSVVFWSVDTFKVLSAVIGAPVVVIDVGLSFTVLP